MDLDAIGNVFLHRGPVLFDIGDEERGLADLERGVALWRKTSGLFMLARNMMMLADYQIRAKQPEEACISLGEADALPKRPRTRITRGNHPAAWPDLPERRSPRRGQAVLRQAIARSRDQRARLFELHAARDLVSLCASRRPNRGARKFAPSWHGFRPALTFLSSRMPALLQ